MGGPDSIWDQALEEPGVPGLLVPLPTSPQISRRDEYFRMKLQWKSVSPEQERRNSLLHGYRSLIGEIPVRFGGLHLLL